MNSPDFIRLFLQGCLLGLRILENKESICWFHRRNLVENIKEKAATLPTGDNTRTFEKAGYIWPWINLSYATKKMINADKYLKECVWNVNFLIEIMLKNFVENAAELPQIKSLLLKLFEGYYCFSKIMLLFV